MEESVKSEVAAVTTESTQLGLVLDSVEAKVADLQESTGAMDFVIWPIVEHSYAMLEPLLWS